MQIKHYYVNVDYEKVQAVHTDHKPILHAFLLNTSPEIPLQKKRPAVIICSGGGYERRSDREGEPVAARFIGAGIQAFILDYSVAPARYPSAMLELAQAVKMVRARAEEWGIDRNKILVCGFSAGGHLAASLGTMWDDEVVEKTIFNGEISGKEKEWKPNGIILGYPVLTCGDYAHQGSKDNLIGAGASEELVKKVSLENRVDKNTPPAFIWHTVDDSAVPVENALMFSAALQKNKIPFELHIYPSGPHGLSLCDETTAACSEHLQPHIAGWIQMAARWVHEL